jgi:Fe-S-cluster containining protein
MRIVDGHCVALRIDRSAGFLCSVYDRRPQICRDLERGSPQCAGELAEKSARPALV